MKHTPSIKICVSGARDTSICGTDALDMATKLGAAIAGAGAVLTTGAVQGFPLWAAKSAKQSGGTTIGFSPAASAHEHINVFRLSADYQDLIVYTGFGVSGCDLLLTRSSDAIIFGCGRIGTIHEFVGAFQEGKILGILEGDWNTDELLKEIIALDVSRDHDLIIFDKDPHRLVERIIKKHKEITTEIYADKK
jgi:uncharacterized protein (TIGR00725 family)